jgi:Helix-turn-helix domain
MRRTKSQLLAGSDLVDVFYVAQFFRVHPQTIRVWTRRRKIPSISMGTRTILYRKSDLEKVLAKRTIRPQESNKYVTARTEASPPNERVRNPG